MPPARIPCHHRRGWVRGSSGPQRLRAADSDVTAAEHAAGADRKWSGNVRRGAEYACDDRSVSQRYRHWGQKEHCVSVLSSVTKACGDPHRGHAT
jgi:hypothetical protein